MPHFEQTNKAFQDFEANRIHLPGFHDGAQVKPGLIGRHIGDVPFDPALHDASMINPLSVWTQVLGEPHVSLMLVDRPLHVNVVVHKARSTEDPEFTRAKAQVADGLVEAVDNALPGMTDRLHTYLIGDVDETLTSSGVNAISAPEQIEAAKHVADVCQTGLTVVISDFNKLPLEQVSGAEYPMTVGVKVNHPGDVVLPAGIGRISVGGLGEIDTDKPLQLRRANRNLRQHHERIVGRLGRAGISVAHLVYNHRSAGGLGFDIEAADRAIASAIRQATQL